MLWEKEKGELRTFYYLPVLAVGNWISLLNEDSYRRGEVLELSMC